MDWQKTFIINIDDKSYNRAWSRLSIPRYKHRGCAERLFLQLPFSVMQLSILCPPGYIEER